MANETPITIVGNLVADPELRFTPGGDAVCNFRVASTPSKFNKQTNEYEDGEAIFLTVNVWRKPAEYVAESITKGQRVIVNGVLAQRSFQTKEGENRTVFEVNNAEVGPSLKFGSAAYTKGGNGGSQPQPQGNFGQPQQQGQQFGQPQQGGYDPRQAAQQQGGFGQQQGFGQQGQQQFGQQPQQGFGFGQQPVGFGQQ